MTSTAMPMRLSFWEELFTVRGRTNRARWWLTALLVVVMYVIMMLSFMLSLGLSGGGQGVLSILLLLPAFGLLIVSIVISILVGVRRLHDRGKSGHWLWLFYLVPALLGALSQALTASKPYTPEMLVLVSTLIVLEVGISIWGFVELGCLRGTTGPNRFGPDPLADASSA